MTLITRLHDISTCALRTGKALCNERVLRLLNHAIYFGNSDLADGRKLELIQEKLEQIEEELARGRRSLEWQTNRLEHTEKYNMKGKNDGA